MHIAYIDDHKIQQNMKRHEDPDFPGLRLWLPGPGPWLR